MFMTMKYDNIIYIVDDKADNSEHSTKSDSPPATRKMKTSKEETVSKTETTVKRSSQRIAAKEQSKLGNY